MGKDLKGKKLPKGIVQRKTGVYRARVQYHNVVYNLENKDLKTLIQELDNLRYETRHGLKGTNENTILNDWFNVWLKIHKKKNLKESSEGRYEDFYTRYIRPQLGSKRISQITTLDVEQLVQNMADEGYSSKTIRDVYNILNPAIKYAINNKIITFNPCDGVELPKTKKKPVRFFDIEEEKEVLKHMKGRMYENLVIIALGTGMRIGELLGLTWSDIDFNKREISIDKTLVYIKDSKTKKYGFKFQTPKTSQSQRILPMSEEVYKALKEQKAQIALMRMSTDKWSSLEGFEYLVFMTSFGKPVTRRSVQNSLDGVEKAINKERKQTADIQHTEFVPIRHFHPHTFRHTFATRCFEAGLEAKEVQTYLGHASVSITLDLYTHVTKKQSNKGMKKLEEYKNKVFGG